MLKLHSQREEIRVVSDQISSPTSTIELSKACWKIISLNDNQSLITDNQPPVLHWSNNGIASWYDVAVAVGEIGIKIGILNRAAKVIPIKTSEYQTAAKRPPYSVLECGQTRKVLQVDGIHWRVALENLLKEVEIKFQN